MNPLSHTRWHPANLCLRMLSPLATLSLFVCAAKGLSPQFLARRRKPGPRHIGWTLLITVFLIQQGTSLALADSYTEYLLGKAGTRIQTLTGTWNAATEKRTIDQLWRQYRQQQRAAAARLAVGQVAIDGGYPTAFRVPGSSATLTFFFVTTDTFSTLPAPGPAVTSVEYRVNTDPYNPTSFTTIGSSTNAGANFSLSYVVGINEPTIEAIPKDASGTPIVLIGVDNENVARGLGTALVVDTVPALGLAGVVGLLVVLLLAGIMVLRRAKQPVSV